MSVKRELQKMVRNKIVQREDLFPLYNISQKRQAEEKKLRKTDLDREIIDQIKEAMAKLTLQEGQEHVEIYNIVYNFLIAEKREEFDDGLFQMQHVYKADVKPDKKRLEELSVKQETDRRKAETELDKNKRKSLKKVVE